MEEYICKLIQDETINGIIEDQVNGFIQEVNSEDSKTIINGALHSPTVRTLIERRKK